MDAAGTLSELEKNLLNDYQQAMSLSVTPFADMATELGVSEDEVIATLQRLKAAGAISRVGPVFRANRVGVSTLAAMAVAPQDLETVAGIVSARAEVNHNYQRDHAYNLWFVVTATSDAHLDTVLRGIEQDTGHPLMSLPMLEDYFIDLGFSLPWA